MKSKMNCWWPTEHGSSAALLEKDLSKQPNHSTKADPTDPLTGAGDWAPCTVPLHEAEMPHPSQIQLKSWLAACSVPCAVGGYVWHDAALSANHG